ncbi:MAG: ABC transporter substrate-binding protein [Candidatus Omnitrophica bacterium]|nr:ABC transporter substrate-binding protein [Candidatus Omnitrophota bacterium]
MHGEIINRASRVVALLFFFCAVSSAQELYRMLDSPQPFTGAESQTADSSELTAVRIGFFAPGEDFSAAARSLMRGVSLAVETINENGGCRGLPLELTRRWADDPWGAGSKEMIRMLYRDKVWAVIGSIGAESTHIAEQIVTKAYAPLVSPIVSDSSLTHINLPWIFRLPPDDYAQARVLVEQGVKPMNLRKAGLLTSTDHDGRYAAAELKKVLGEQGIAPAFHLTLSPDAAPLEDIARRIQRFNPDCLMIRFPADRFSSLLSALQGAGVDIPLFVPWIPGLKSEFLISNYSGSITLVEPFSEPKQCGVYLKFMRDYIHRYGEKPDACAAYGYDALSLIARAIENEGFQRSRLAKGIRDLSRFPGVSGVIEWDNGGGNLGKPVVRTLSPQ